MQIRFHIHLNITIKKMLLDSQWLALTAQARNEQQVRMNLEVAEGQYLYIDREFSSLMYRGIKMIRIIRVEK